jgi:predicted O-methyltransferase YrrM
MDGPNPLLAEGGVILADNSLCALLYDAGDERRQKLHEFNQQVKNDPRVEQVILTIREGITMITRKSPA